MTFEGEGPDMDLLEHYLSAVAAQLGKDQREDIVAELRDTLLTRFEEREEALGRPLTDDEREAILRDMGHPLVVAARYGKGPHHLVGPELFPWWLFAVKAGLMVIVAIQAVVLLLRVFTGAVGPGDDVGFGQAIGHGLDSIMDGALLWIGIATVAGYVMERNGWRPGFMIDWRVKDLPVLRLSDPDAWREAMAGGNPTANQGWKPHFSSPRWPASEALFGVIAGLVFIAWWTGAWVFPGLESFAIRGGEARIEPAPVWAANFLPILLLAIGQVWIELLRLMRPQWVRVIAGLQAIAAAVGLAIVWVVFDAGHWFNLVDGETVLPIAGDWIQLDFDRLRALEGRSRDLIGTSSTLSLVLSWIMVGVMLSLAVSIVTHLWKLVRGAR